MKIMQKKGEAEQILEIWFQIWNLRKKLEKKHLFPQCIIFIFYLNRKAALWQMGPGLRKKLGQWSVLW